MRGTAPLCGIDSAQPRVETEEHPPIPVTESTIPLAGAFRLRADTCDDLDQEPFGANQPPALGDVTRAPLTGRTARAREHNRSSHPSAWRSTTLRGYTAAAVQETLRVPGEGLSLTRMYNSPVILVGRAASGRRARRSSHGYVELRCRSGAFGWELSTDYITSASKAGRPSLKRTYSAPRR